MAASAEITVLVSVVVNFMLSRAYTPCWAIFMDGNRVFLTQVNCGLYHHLVKLLHLTSLKLRKGLVDYYEVGKTE